MTVCYICEVILAVLIMTHLIKSYFSRDDSQVWSPLTVISLTYIYYCTIPFFGGVQEKYEFNERLYDSYLFHIAALLSYISIYIGFHIKGKSNFKKWNSIFSDDNMGKIGLCLFFVALILYVPFRGLHLSFAATNEEQALASGGLIYYFISAIDMFSVSAALMVLRLKKTKSILLYIFPVWIILSTFLFAGARWRLVILFYTVISAYCLYPRIRKPNLVSVAVIAVVVFWGFSAMDMARNYSRGIDMNILKSLSFNDIKEGAQENSDVYTFSIQCMDLINKTGERVYFEPITTAICMPIPRSVFPRKPSNEYLTSLEDKILGNSLGGAAMLNFVEAFYSFGWFGIILYGLLLGWISRKVWDNYKKNQKSIGAIIILSVFSALCYCVISRGYLASTLTNIILVLILPFLLSSLFSRIAH